MNLKDYFGKIIPSLLLLFLSGCTAQNNPTYVKVTFKAFLNNVSGSEKVYITGNNEKLGNWSPDKIIMDRHSDSLFTKTIYSVKGSKIEFKITKGSWKKEGVDKDGWVFNNFSFTPYNDTTAEIKISRWINEIYERKIDLSYFERNDPGLVLIYNWKYHPGDDTAFAGENVNDTSWETSSSILSPDLFPHTGWDNVGWFRMHFNVDSSLWNKSEAIMINQLGASEIYFNGKLIYKAGETGKTGSNYKPLQSRLWKEIRFEPKTHQVIAVRYSNYNWKEQSNIEFSPGFVIYIQNINLIFQQFTNDVRGVANHQMVYTLIPLILFVLHLLLFSFYPKQIQNLFYSISLLGFAGITYFTFEKFIETDPGTIILYYKLNVLSVPVAIYFGILTAFAIIYQKIPRRSWLYLIVFLFYSVSVILYPIENRFLMFLKYTLVAVSMVDIFISGYWERKNKIVIGSWIITAGFIILNIFILLQVLIDFSVISAFGFYNQVFVYGLLAFTIAMSVFLSHNFAHVNKDLEVQLATVKLLSEQAIAQERLASKTELERKLMEADYEKKSKELEDARELQLSLLPKEIPKLKNFEIDCYMRTATEVGGDYYDILPTQDDTLTLAIGDATGHGVKAGTLVAVVKGLFQELDNFIPLNSALLKIHQTLRVIHFNNLYMSLSLIRLNGNNISVSSAGMPPVMIFRKDSGSIQELTIKHLPLGAPINKSYELHQFGLSVGDMVLFMTDGLMELFNNSRDMFDCERIKKVMLENSDGSPRQLINSLICAADDWRKEKPQLDDITFLVIRCIEPEAMKTDKYKWSDLTAEKSEEYLEKLLLIMDEKKLYLDGSLNLQALAKLTGASPQHLSQVINEKTGNSFFDFVNGYRVKEAQRLLAECDDSIMTVLAIAEEAGFNSKSSFNTAFKKFTGLTPSEYKKSLSCSSS